MRVPRAEEASLCAAREELAVRDDAVERVRSPLPLLVLEEVRVVREVALLCVLVRRPARPDVACGVYSERERAAVRGLWEPPSERVLPPMGYRRSACAPAWARVTARTFASAATI